jgi:hypothetical protein
MKLSHLIEALEDFADVYGDIEVRVAHQPGYPLMASVQQVTLVEKAQLSTRRYESNEKQPCVFIACGESSEYAPKEAWEGGVVSAEDEEDEDEPRR